MHAVERYETISEKLREVSEELENVKEEAAGLMAAFERIKKTRQGLFNECFKHVSESLGVIYRDLTRSSKHPLGGNAYLTLDNTEVSHNLLCIIPNKDIIPNTYWIVVGTLFIWYALHCYASDETF
jgi:chromosome segregation ATPase